MVTATRSDLSVLDALRDVRIAVARSADDAHTPATQLLDMGAELVYYPCFDTLPPEDSAEFDNAIQQLAAAKYDWLFLVSASAVIVLADRLEQLSLDPGVLANTKLALFGSNTRLAAADLLRVDLEQYPEAPSHSDLLEALPLASGQRALLPVPPGYHDSWLANLAEREIQVQPVVAYQTPMGRGGDELPEMLWSGEVDAIAFTSETNVDYFARRLHYEGGTLAMLDDVCVACIGPRTSAAARDRGLRIQVEPVEHTPDGLAAALAAYFAQARSQA